MDYSLSKLSINFTQVANEVLNNRALSAKAKGIYAYLYSKPDGWNFSADRICNDFMDGRKAILSGLKELEASGYLRRAKNLDGTVSYFIQYKPESPNGTLGADPKSQRGTLGPISNTNQKKILLNSNTEATAADAAGLQKQIGELFDVFKKSVNPTISFGHTTNRKAAAELIAELGFDKALSAVKHAVRVQGQRFAPVITTPYQLKLKLAELRIYYAREQSKAPIIV